MTTFSATCDGTSGTLLIHGIEATPSEPPPGRGFTLVIKGTASEQIDLRACVATYVEKMGVVTLAKTTRDVPAGPKSGSVESIGSYIGRAQFTVTSAGAVVEDVLPVGDFTLTLELQLKRETPRGRFIHSLSFETSKDAYAAFVFDADYR